MKKIVFLLLLCLPVLSQAQSLEKNKKDKYTGRVVRETSREVLAMPFKNALRYRFKMIDSSLFFIANMTTHKLYFVSKDDEIIFLLDNEKTVVLKCTDGYIPEDNGDFYFGTGYYAIDPKSRNRFLKHKVVGVRVYTSTGYWEFDKVKEKNSEKFQHALELILK